MGACWLVVNTTFADRVAIQFIRPFFPCTIGTDFLSGSCINFFPQKSDFGSTIRFTYNPATLVPTSFTAIISFDGEVGPIHMSDDTVKLCGRSVPSITICFYSVTYF
jgi:hypothetical protein